MYRLPISRSLIFNYLVKIFPRREKPLWPALNFFYYPVIITFVIMFQSGEFTPFNLNKNLLLGITFFIWLAGSIYSGQFKNIDFGFLGYFFIFSLLVIISGFHALDKRYVLFEFAKWMRLPLIYLLLINNIQTKKQLDIFLLMLGYFICAALLYGIYEFNFNPDYIDPVRYTNRATSVFNHPNVWSPFILSMLPFLFFLLIQNRNITIRKTFFLIFIILAGINLYLAKSRLGLTVAVLLMIYLFMRILLADEKIKNISLKILFLALPVFLLLIASLGVLEKGFLTRCIERAEFFSKSDLSLLGRIAYLEIALAIIRDHPLAGVGAGNYPLISKVYAPWLKDDTGLTAGVHNKYLNIAVETGLLAMMAFVIFLTVHLTLLWKTLRESKNSYVKQLSESLLLSLVVYMGYLLFEISASTVITWYFGIILGLIVVLNREKFLWND